jgi:hypothetical protein
MLETYLKLMNGKGKAKAVEMENNPSDQKSLIVRQGPLRWTPSAPYEIRQAKKGVPCLVVKLKFRN